MQEFLQIVLNKTKLTLCLFGLFTFVAFSQQTADISLELSVEPSMTMYPGQQGTMIFQVLNSGSMIVDHLDGNHIEAIQFNGVFGIPDIYFDWESITGGCSFSPDLVPSNHSLIFLILHDVGGNSLTTCKIDFTIPIDNNDEFYVFSYQFSSNLPDSNPNNNTASVRINIQPRTVGIPTLSLWGLLILVLGLLLLVKYRRRILF